MNLIEPIKILTLFRFTLCSEKRLRELIEENKKLWAVVRASRALKGDLDAKDESPTHFCSYFTLTDAIEALEKE